MSKSVIALIIVVLIIIGGGITWAVTKSEDTTESGTQEAGIDTEESFDSSEFTKDKKEKSLTGEQHSLLNMGLEYTANYDRVVFSFSSNATGQAPGYIAELDGDTISIRFYDTRDVDMAMQKVYEGQDEIDGEGKIIEKAELWYPHDDSSIGVKITLKQAKGFRISEEGLFISLDVDCGCGG